MNPVASEGEGGSEIILIFWQSFDSGQPIMALGALHHTHGPHDLSRRTMAAPSARAFSLPKAEARSRYFMPQSGAGTSR